MLRIRANYAHDSLAVNHLALVANFSDGSPNLHLKHRSLVTICDTPAVEIVGRQLNQNPIARKNSDEVLAHLSRNVRQHLVLIVLKLDSEHCVGQSLKDLGHNFYRFFLRHRSTGRDSAFSGKLRIVACPLSN